MGMVSFDGGGGGGSEVASAADDGVTMSLKLWVVPWWKSLW